MSTFEMPTGELPNVASTTEEIARFVVEAAVNAPSVDNTQPWGFYGADHEIGVHADEERRLPVADPAGREMMLSCGAALVTARGAPRYPGVLPKLRVVPKSDLRTPAATRHETESAP